jgi:GT2 family glycosyltransferase
VTRVSVVVVAFGGVPLLDACIRSVLASVDVDVDVVVVDNGASPTALAAAQRDGVAVVDAGGNLGFGAGCNLGAAKTTADVIAFINPDTIVEPAALAALAEVARRDDVGIASASVRLKDRPHLLNSGGGAIHFVGLGWADRFEHPATSIVAERDVAAASGAAMAMRRVVFDDVGGFAEKLFLYHEDAELSLHAWLRGYRVVYVPDAVVLHDYEFSRNARKLYYLERNRLAVVLTCFGPRLLATVTPALIAYELGMVVVAVAQGWWREKTRGWAWLVRHRAWLRTRRREVQARRVRSDAEIASLLASRFSDAPIGLPSVLAPADALLGLYWRVAKRAL